MKVLTSLNEETAGIADRVMAALVRVHNGARNVGAGVIWHPSGLIITNAHVVVGRERAAARSLGVTLHDGRELVARIAAVDKDHDLAALRVDAEGLPAIELGDSRRLAAGNLVFALGFPWGVTGGMTAGVVIGVGDDLPELSTPGREWISASLHLRPGHSGGALFDGQGRLVGINTLMTGPDVGAAVPVHVAVAFLKRAIHGNRKADAQGHPVL